MDFSELSVGTPRVLNNCLDLFQNPAPDSLPFRSVPSTPAKYALHPDFQFFSSVKAKHHYAYHKLKREPAVVESSHSSRSSLFQPFSRELLLKRLRTFNALNWNIPLGPIESLTELDCAASGWTCESISRNNNTKNHLRCSTCSLELVLRFNSEDQQPAFVPFEFDLDDIHQINSNLVLRYIEQIHLTGHRDSCPWKMVRTPLLITYYPTPHLAATNEALISEYLVVLRNLMDNLPVIEMLAPSTLTLIPLVSPRDHTEFARVSNEWLLNRYFRENKENFSAVLESTCPPWLYWLAVMGWDLNAQKFASQTVLLMICTTCNQRVFLNPLETTLSPVEGPSLSSSKTLTPCNFPPSIVVSSNFSTEYLEDMEEVESSDQHFSHKPWCLHAGSVDNMPFYEYFRQMLIELEKNIGPTGEYEADKDMSVDVEPSELKRKSSFDVNEGMERLAKLRKLYFID